VLRRSAVSLMFALALAVAACGGGDNPNEPSTPPPTGPANLVIEDLTVGTGAEATGGKLLTVAYALYAYEPTGVGGRGQLLQSSSFQFRQGTNGVIPGFEQGTASMLVGGIRRITIPPSLAYGATGNPPLVRANEWIVFDVQLLAVAD
jgi:FKBP-type peptidyl-prolyl cis-trans isomerase FkpA